MRAGPLLLLLALAACGGPPPPPGIDPAATCGPVLVYTPAQQGALADAMDVLPALSPIRPAMRDYSHMRDVARACRAAAGAKP